MPEIFLSYNREDASVAKLFADAFARQGMEVWWDQTLRSGDTYDEVTEAALRGAKAVVVLWSPRSVVSHWVRAEATIAHRAKTLVPAVIEACNKPVMFELTQTADLSHWRGKADDLAWQAFVGDVRRMLGREAGQRGVVMPQASVAKTAPGPLRRYAPMLAALLLILAAGLTYAFVKSRGASPVSASQAGAQAGKVSVAVLPFRNLSADKDQEFFSDGMTEEITSALAKVPGLNVVSRTSAFQFKGENRDMRAIGQALGASHLIEGSVRKEGNALRINAQLVKADDGKELWSESYDRELKGVFALQEEIAKAIAGALRVPLGLRAGQSLVANRTVDTDSYETYLRARALVRGRGELEPGGPLTQAAQLLEKVVARDPDYAPAWAMLAQAYNLTPNFSRAFQNGETDGMARLAMQVRPKSEAAADQAIRLDPESADSLTAMILVRRTQRRYAEAEDLCARALSVDPGHSDALQHCGTLLALLGKLDDSLRLRRRLQTTEPFVAAFNRNTAQALWITGRTDDALAIVEKIPPLPPNTVLKAQLLASQGRYKEAANSIDAIPAGWFKPGFTQEAARLLRLAPAKAEASDKLPSASPLGFVYMYTQAPDRALDLLESITDSGGTYPIFGAYLWSPAYAPLRKTEHVKALVRKMGLVDYWRERGWPKYCHPVGDADFACS